MRFLLFYAFLFLCCIACEQTTQFYEPSDLRKLTREEILERARNREVIAPDAVFRLQDGQLANLDSLRALGEGEEAYATDQYAGADGQVKELVIRRADPEDVVFRKELMQAMQEGPALEKVDVDCSDKAAILEAIYESDQGMRRDGAQMDPDVDRQNLATVLSLVEQCGMPMGPDDTNRMMSTVWLVIQHGPSRYQKQYLPQLKEAARQGALSASNIALMEDRVLLNDDQPQIYGSQVTSGPDGKYVLHELADPQYVDQRRATVGLGPLRDYLSHWDIVFDVEQLEK